MEEADGAGGPTSPASPGVLQPPVRPEGGPPRGRPSATSPKNVERLSPVASARAGEAMLNFSTKLAIPQPPMKPIGSSQFLAAPVPPITSPRGSEYSRSSVQSIRSDQVVATRPAAGEKRSPGGFSDLSGSSIRRGLAGDNNPLLAAIRREVEASEVRAAEHMIRVERRLEQLCEAGRDRVESRLVEIESWQGDYEGRIAELTGSIKGMKDQLSRVLRAMTEMDGRLWQSKNTAEEAWRLKASALEAQVEALVSETRQALTAGEDSSCRFGEHIRRLDASFQDLSSNHNHRLHIAEASLEALTAVPPGVVVSDAHSEEGGVPTIGQPTVTNSFSFGPRAAGDNAKRFATDLRRLQVQSDEQEVRLGDLVEKVKWQESLIRTERDRVVRSEWDILSGGRGIVGAVANGARVVDDDDGEPVEVGFAQDVRSHGEALDEVSRVVQRIQAFRTERQLGSPAFPAGASTSIANSDEPLANQVRQLHGSVAACEAAVHGVLPQLLATLGEPMATGPGMVEAVRELKSACDPGVCSGLGIHSDREANTVETPRLGNDMAVGAAVDVAGPWSIEDAQAKRPPARAGRHADDSHRLAFAGQAAVPRRGVGGKTQGGGDGGCWAWFQRSAGRA